MSIIKGLNKDIVIILTEKDLKTEGQELDFFEDKELYSVEIRRLKDDKDFTVYGKTYKI